MQPSVARVQLRRPEAAYLRHIAHNLRTADARELQAVHGPDLDLEQCLVTAVASSEEAHVAFTAKGEPFAVFGVAPVSLLGGQGCPWLLGTDVMRGYGRDIVVLSREHVARWGLRYPELFNYVDARNLRAIAWLRHTGFTIHPARPYGLAGEPFHRFERCT